MRKRKRKWRKISDSRVRHRWDLECSCPGVERRVYVEPTCYAEAGGIPICEECGQDRKYIKTEVLR